MEAKDCSSHEHVVRQRARSGARLGLALAIVIAALALVGSASPDPGALRALSAARATDEPFLDDYPDSTALGAHGDLDVFLHVPGMNAAKVVLVVPTGYGLRTDQALGTNVGLSIGWSASLGRLAEIAAVDPAPYATDPRAQACAPGPHAAVWLFELGRLGGPSASVAIFVDPTSSGAGTSAYQLQFCLPQPATAALGLDGLELDIDSALTNPGTARAYDWSAQVTPATPAGTPDQAATYELRSLVPIPSRVTLRGRPDRGRRHAILSGRLIAPSINVAGTPINLFSRPSGAGHYRYQTWTRTTASGGFSFRWPLRGTTSYHAAVGSIEDCPPPSTAPAGCRSETLDTTSSPTVRFRKR